MSDQTSCNREALNRLFGTPIQAVDEHGQTYTRREMRPMAQASQRALRPAVKPCQVARTRSRGAGRPAGRRTVASQAKSDGGGSDSSSSEPGEPAPPRYCLTKREIRAEQLAQILTAPTCRVLTVEDIFHLPQLRKWNRLAIEIAIGDLVHDGLLTDDAYGRTSVTPKRVTA